MGSAISAALAFGSAWQIQSWRFDAKETKRAKQETVEERSNFLRYERDQQRVLAAEATATKNVSNLRVALERTRTELDGLRVTTTAASVKAATASNDALVEYTVAANAVLEQCTSEYIRMAEKAEGHAIDVRALTEAWPK